MFSLDEILGPLQIYANKVGTILCHQVSVQDYSKLIITHSSLTVYTHSELFTCFQNSRHSRLISVNMFHYLLICVQLFLIKTTTAIVLNSLMKYLLPRGNILKSLMLHEQRYLHIILIASLTLLSLYIHLDFQWCLCHKLSLVSGIFKNINYALITCPLI